MATRRAVCALILSLLFATAGYSQALNVVTLAGSTSGGGYVDAAGTDARFSFPQGVAVDRDGNVFVSDRGNHVIRRITPAGEVTTFAGTPGVSGSADGAGTAARFYHPAGLALDPASNVLYVADSWNHTIRAVTREGVVTTVAGSAGRFGGVDGDGSAARFSYPQGISIDQGIGTVTAVGSRSILVTANRTYTLTATGPGGTVTATATVSLPGGRRRSARH